MRFNNTQLSAAISATNRNRILGLMVFAGLASTGSAVDYSAGTSISANASHNDNLRLTESNKVAVNKYLVVPILTFGANTENSKLELDSTFFFNRYDKSQFNSDDQNIGLAYTYNFENSSVGLNANIVRDSTITSETLTSGIISEKAERTERYQAAPSWSYTINETNLLQLNGTYSRQDYRTTGYTGYKNIDSTLSWIRIVNERLKLILSGRYSDYHSDDSQSFDIPGNDTGIEVQTGIDSTTRLPIIQRVIVPKGFFGQQSYATRNIEKGGQVGLDYQWSEAALLQARLGRSRSKNEFIVNDPQNLCNMEFGLIFAGLCSQPDSDGTQSTAELDWSWSNERHQLGLNATKSTQPSSNGYVVDTTQVGSFWTFKLTELDQISTNLTLVRNRAIDKQSSLLNTSAADRDYGTATITYRRQFGDHWFANTSYQFSRQKYSDFDIQASSNTISLGIQYMPQEWHWSR